MVRDIVVNYLYFILFSAAFLVVECFAGGTRLIYSLPAYTILGLAALPAAFQWKSTKVSARPACLVASAIFFGYVLARCKWSEVEYLARTDFFMVLASLVIYLITALVFVRGRHRMLLVAVLMLIAVGQVGVGLVQFSRGNDFMLFGYSRYPNENRASGQYVSPNHFAGYLEVVGVFAASLVFWGTWRPWAKILAGYVAVVAAAGVVISGSRGGYLSTGACILCFCALSVIAVKIAFPERFTRVVIMVVVAMLLVSAAIPVLVTSQMVRRRAGDIVAKNDRVYLWQAAISQFHLNPVFGTGSGSYLYYGRMLRSPQIQKDPVRVHNDYLDLLAEYGALGGAAFLLFLGTHLWNGFYSFRWLVNKRLQFSSDWRSNSLALVIASLCAVAAYIVHSVVDFNLHIPANAMLMAFVFGILANPGLETFQAKSGTMIVNRCFQCVIFVIGLSILILGTPKIPGEYYAEQARVALRDEKYVEAVRFAKTALAWEKRNPDVYYYLGESRRRLGDGFPPPLQGAFYQLASASFKQGLSLFPQDVRFMLVEGWTLDALGKFDESQSYFDQAMYWDPNWIQVQESYKEHSDFVKSAKN